MSNVFKKTDKYERQTPFSATTFQIISLIAHYCRERHSPQTAEIVTESRRRVAAADGATDSDIDTDTKAGYGGGMLSKCGASKVCTYSDGRGQARAPSSLALLFRGEGRAYGSAESRCSRR